MMHFVAAESLLVLNNVISIFQAARRRDRERLLQLEEEGTDLELELRYVGIIFYPLGIFSKNRILCRTCGTLIKCNCFQI